MRLRTLGLLVVLLGLGAGPARAGVRAPDPARLGLAPVAVRDHVGRPPAIGARAASRAVVAGSIYTTARGERVRVALSAAYGDVPALGARWAQFLAGLVHGAELSRATTYVARPAEVERLCGRDSDACYDPSPELLVVPGEDPPDGQPFEEVAAHEYGHHVAANRVNAPWDAYAWGTKRWATHERVCTGVAAGRDRPGDEGDGYADNPGEAFADAYRVLNGGAWSGLFATRFRPDAVALELLRQDVLSPWTAPTREERTGTASAATRRASISVATPWDGRLRARLRAAPGADLDLVALDARGRVVRSAARVGSERRLAVGVCGQRAVRLGVVRRRGSGPWSLTVERP